jgi:hypothetical protein
MVKKKSVRRRINKEWLVIVLLIVTQAVSVLYLYRLNEMNTITSRQVLDTLLIRAEERRYLDPIIDIKENRVYIPEARVYLPLNNISRNIVYNYQTSFPPQKQLILSTKQVVGMQPNQATALCDQIVTLSSLPIQDSKEVIKVQTTMKGGLQYVTTLDADCHTLYSKETADKIIDTVKAIASY